MRKPLRILIVEDEQLTAKSLQMDLQELGFNVLKPVVKGEVAVDVALEENPSLILMDMRLAGGMDGVKAAEAIHQKKKIPIAFMTGYATEYFQERIQGISPVGILEKPVSVNKIKEILDAMK